MPPGGRIEFEERSDVAPRREIREELGTEIDRLVLIGVLESLFTFDGQQEHEIVFVYDARFRDKSLYITNRLQGTESDGSQYNAVWLELDTIGPDTPPVYPDGLLQ